MSEKITTTKLSTKKQRATKRRGTKASTKGELHAAPKEPREPKLSLLDAASQVLKAKGERMNCRSMIERVFAEQLWHSDAPTPHATLSSAILREVKSRKGE